MDQILLADQIQSLIVDLATIIPNSSQPSTSWPPSSPNEVPSPQNHHLLPPNPQHGKSSSLSAVQAGSPTHSGTVLHTSGIGYKTKSNVTISRKQLPKRNVNKTERYRNVATRFRHPRCIDKLIGQLRKRKAPILAGLNVVNWITRVVRWIYHITDRIPHLVQQRVNREYEHIQEAQLETKMDQADEKVKEITAKEFPDFFKKKYLDPYESGSELHTEHEQLLHSHHPPRKRQINWEQPHHDMTI